MSALALAARDSATMVRRQLKRLVRYPSMTVQLVITPVIILFLFVYVLGGTLGGGRLVRRHHRRLLPVGRRHLRQDLTVNRLDRAARPQRAWRP
ncbi:hypothetical protein ABGB12_12625 [Actinocorallia sp. B10E7]|uniref:hypothetical protein n=1 Tax=Actinocorallia sp. B10E7 TaxID=3153558 RepID=UPI00325E37F3